MTISKRIPTRFVFNRVQKLQKGFINNRSPKHNLQPSSVRTQFSVSKFGVVDNKLKTFFLQLKETYELYQQCPRIHAALPHFLVSLRSMSPVEGFRCLRVSKADLLWFLKGAVIANVSAPISSCWFECQALSKICPSGSTTYAVRPRVRKRNECINQLSKGANQCPQATEHE